jgi:hypothetical protein
VSGGGRDLVVAFSRFRGSGASARTRARLIFHLYRERTGAIGTDRGRKHVERKAIVVGSIDSRAAILIVSSLFGTPLFAESPRTPITLTVPAGVALAAIDPALTLLVAAVGFGRFRHLLALVLIGIVALTRSLVLEAGAVLTENPEIMVGVLEVIFGLDPVTCQLGIARQALVFFVQLRGVAALTVVLAVPRLSTEVLPSLPSAAATAATLSLIDQMLRPYAGVL